MCWCVKDQVVSGLHPTIIRAFQGKLTGDTLSGNITGDIQHIEWECLFLILILFFLPDGAVDDRNKNVNKRKRKGKEGKERKRKGMQKGAVEEASGT